MSFLKVAEVAAILKVAEGSVRSMVKNGQLPALYIGNEIRIKESDVHALTGTTTPPPPRNSKPLSDAQKKAREKFAAQARARGKKAEPPASTKISAPKTNAVAAKA